MWSWSPGLPEGAVCTLYDCISKYRFFFFDTELCFSVVCPGFPKNKSSVFVLFLGLDLSKTWIEQSWKGKTNYTNLLNRASSQKMRHSKGHGQTSYLSFDLEHSVYFFSGRQSEIWKTKDQECLWTGCIILVILPQRRILLRRCIINLWSHSCCQSVLTGCTMKGQDLKCQCCSMPEVSIHPSKHNFDTSLPLLLNLPCCKLMILPDFTKTRQKTLKGFLNLVQKVLSVTS